MTAQSAKPTARAIARCGQVERGPVGRRGCAASRASTSRVYASNWSAGVGSLLRGRMIYDATP